MTATATLARFARRRPRKPAPRHSLPWDLDAELVLPRHRPGRYSRTEVSS